MSGLDLNPLQIKGQTSKGEAEECNQFATSAKTLQTLKLKALPACSYTLGATSKGEDTHRQNTNFDGTGCTLFSLLLS